MEIPCRRVCEERITVQAVKVVACVTGPPGHVVLNDGERRGWRVSHAGALRKIEIVVVRLRYCCRWQIAVYATIRAENSNDAVLHHNAAFININPPGVGPQDTAFPRHVKRFAVQIHTGGRVSNQAMLKTSPPRLRQNEPTGTPNHRHPFHVSVIGLANLHPDGCIQDGHVAKFDAMRLRDNKGNPSILAIDDGPAAHFICAALQDHVIGIGIASIELVEYNVGEVRVHARVYV